MHWFIRTLVLVPALLLGAGRVPAQESRMGELIVVGGEERQALPGSHILRDQESRIRRMVAENPGILAGARLQKQTTWSFTVGSTHSWYADDLTSTNPDPNARRYLVPSTCRAVGTNSYIFVEDQSWTGGRVNQAVVDSVVAVFDLRTPANPSKGVHDTCVESFGNPPNIDGDPRIVILILDIRDGYSGSGGYIGGYFYSFNQIPRSVPGYATSNEAEIYFLDSDPLDLNSPSGLRTGMGITSHEFQHMIHFNYDVQELTFFNEMCSLVSEVICGYPVYNQSYYVQETNHYLLDWRSGDPTAVLRDYSRASRFGLYVHDQLGSGIFRYIVASTMNGIAGFDDGLAASGTTARRFDDMFIDWLVANILDDSSVDPKYGYLYPALPKATGTTYNDPNVPVTGGSLDRLAASYLTFAGGTQLGVTFTVDHPSMLIKAVEVGPSSKRVVDVTPESVFLEPEFGSTYTEVHFVVINPDQVFARGYTYTASGSGVGAVELKWDELPPVGYLAQASDDTICVTFGAQPGARLDSVRVNLSRPGSMSGGIWQHTGVQRPTPLGSPFVVPVTATAPASGWVTVDLTAHQLDAGSAFAVGFVNAGDGVSSPRVMVTTHPSSGAYHSYSYLNNPGSGTPDWYYLTKSVDTVWIYLVRAYVSFPTTDADVEEMNVPRRISLSQNFPNPFNPMTTIPFAIPSRSRVTLSVFSVMGEHVVTLVDGEMEAGEHVVDWEAEGLASGPYFYRLQTGGFVESRMMLLIR
ncbi:MAG: hypothetical protein WBH55_15910 [Bacteroidota bacterium]